MRIDELTVTNFAGFEHRTIRFHPRFNLLVGDNGSGKSSVIDALAIALGSWFLGMPGLGRGPEIPFRAIRLASYRHADSWTFEPQYPSRVECSGLVMRKEIQWAREVIHEVDITTTAAAESIKNVAEEVGARVRAGEDVTLPLIREFGTARLSVNNAPGNMSRHKPSRLDGYLDAFHSSIDAARLISWFGDETMASLQIGKDTIALRAAKNALTACIEGAQSVYYDARYSNLVVSSDGMAPQFMTNLSDGLRVMLMLVGDLAIRATMLNPHLAEAALRDTPGVVLIDELDLHLHPKWQRRVIGDLKRTFPSLQFIATTHSPQLIGEALPEEIRMLDDPEASTPPHSFGLDSSRILEEVMGAGSRDNAVGDLLSRLFRSIDEERFDHARQLLSEAEAQLGTEDPEITRARSLMAFLETDA